ncbi:hypothetical protein FWH58_03680, partial [Candidatus Saccharibacteria bacterium]|nr:hypothetical protein [Candidatus Saccharibacteria bacterium]
TSASMPGLAPNRQTVDDEAKRGGDGLAGRESDELDTLTPAQDLEEEFGRDDFALVGDESNSLGFIYFPGYARISA